MAKSSAKSYVVTCPTYFKNAVNELAEKRKVTVGDIARSVMLLVDAEKIEQCKDPGEPSISDREEVVLKTGKSKGRRWRRKPRIQVRMPSGFDISFIRRIFAAALEIDAGNLLSDEKTEERPQEPSEEILAEIGRLEKIISILSFEPLENGIRNQRDALYVMGFPPSVRIDRKKLNTRYRLLAMIHHPDSSHGSHRRMSQLNSAMEILKKKII